MSQINVEIMIMRIASFYACKKITNRTEGSGLLCAGKERKRAIYKQSRNYDNLPVAHSQTQPHAQT